MSYGPSRPPTDHPGRQYRDWSAPDAAWGPILDQIGQSDTVNLVLVPDHLKGAVGTCARVAVHEAQDRCIFAADGPDAYIERAHRCSASARPSSCEIAPVRAS
jgi:hypothetical protein